MLWLAAGILFAVFNAGTMLVSQKYKIDGVLMSGLRGVGVAAIYSPAAFFVPFPESPEFWALIVLEGVLSSFFNSRLYASAARFGAGTTSRISMLAVPIGLVMWWIIMPKRFFELEGAPLVFAGLAVSMAAICLSFYKMSSGGGAMRGQLAFLTPAVVVLAVMMIVRKVAMEAVAFESAAVYYPLCAIFLSGAINLTVFALHSGGAKLVGALSSKRIITAGILMSAVSSATIFFGNLSALYVPNPAYLSALSLTAPLWIMVADKFLGVPDKVDSRWLAAMLLSICALIFFAQIPIAPPSDSPVSAGGHAPVAAK